MRYLENKAALNEALERLNWPISLKELSLLENEILAGKMYIQQAMELQEAARKENYVSRALAEVSALDGSVFPSSLLSRVPAVPVRVPPLSPTPTTLVTKRVSANPTRVPGLLSTGRKCRLILLWLYLF